MNIAYALMLLPYDLFERGIPYALLDAVLIAAGFWMIHLWSRVRPTQSEQDRKYALRVNAALVLQQAAPVTFALFYLNPSVSGAMELVCVYFAHFVAIVSLAAIHFNLHRKRLGELR